MIALSHLKERLHSLFALAYSNSMTIEVAYKKRVFKVTIQPTGEEWTGQSYLQVRRRYRQKRKKGNIPMSPNICKECGYLELQGICMNKECSTSDHIKRQAPGVKPSTKKADPKTG